MFVDGHCQTDMKDEVSAESIPVVIPAAHPYFVIYGLPCLRKRDIQLGGDGCCHISGFFNGTLFGSEP
jgi:hypothetical protein